MKEFGYWSKRTTQDADKTAAEAPAAAPVAGNHGVDTTRPRRSVGDFGDWFGRSADETAERIDGQPPVSGGKKDDGYNPDRLLPVPVPTGSEIGNVELVTGTAGTGVRAEDEFNSFRSGGRDFGTPLQQGGAAKREQDCGTGFDMSL